MSESESIWEIVKRWLQSLFPPHPTKEEALKPQPISETATPETISEAEPTQITITEVREERLTTEPEPLGETFAFPQEQPTWKPYEEVGSSTIDCLIQKGVLTVEEKTGLYYKCVAWYEDGTCRKKIKTTYIEQIIYYQGTRIGSKTIGWEPIDDKDKAKYGTFIPSEEGWTIRSDKKALVKQLAETYGCPIERGLLYE